MPGSRPRASGGVSSTPSRSTKRLVKLPSVRKPSGSVKSDLERARGRARLVVKGAVAGLVAQAEIVGRDRQRRERDRRPAPRAAPAAAPTRSPRSRAATAPAGSGSARRGRSRPGGRCAPRAGRSGNRAPRRSPSSGRDGGRARRRPHWDRSASSRSDRSCPRVATNSPFARHSRHSSPASLSATIAEPSPSRAMRSPAFSTRVRIATLNAASPSGASLPIAPQ